MYRIKQAARFAFDNLVRLLEPHCYLPIQEYPGLWKHQNRSMVFTLCVDILESTPIKWMMHITSSMKS